MKTITVTADILRRTKLLILFSAIAVIVCFGLLSIKAASAKEATDSAKKFNVTFPIEQLGNCSSVEDCKAYCSLEENHDICASFAKKKGFYKENKEGNARFKALLEKAKSEFGCGNETQCKAFCQEEENQAKCQAFAQKYKLGLKPNEASGSGQVLEKAKQFLGCDSHQTCQEFCQLEANHDKCVQFAKMVGLGKGKERPGSQSGQFRGPKEGSGSGEKFTPNSQQAFEHANENARFCREHPEKCKNASGSGNLEERKMMEKKQMMPNQEFKPAQGQNFSTGGFQEPNEQVQGVSTSPSFLDWIFHFFFK